MKKNKIKHLIFRFRALLKM